MFKMTLLSVSIQLINSISSGIYAKSFLMEKYQKKITLAIWIVIHLFIQIAIFEITDSESQVNDIVEVAANAFILFSLQLLLFRKDLSKQVFVILSFMAGKEIVKYIASVFSIVLSGFVNKIFDFLIIKESVNTFKEAMLLENIMTISVSVLSALLYALLLAVYLRTIRIKFVKKDYPLQIQENIFLILPSVAALCISITIKIMIVSVENGMTIMIYDTVPATKFWIPVICILLLGTIVANVILFQKLVQYNEENGKRVMLENQIHQMQKEVTEIQDIYTDMRGLRHDMRDHLSNISLYIKSITSTDNEELKDYIGKMEETVSRLDFFYQTGNPITDIIIQQRSQEARKKQIKFNADFIYPPDQQIDVYDIGIILNNALENAIEACSKAEGVKNIYLRSYMKGNLFFIEIENDYSEDIVIDEKSGLPISNKSNREMHGLGMSNIRRCAKKYMGDMDIVLSNADNKKKFNLTVMMNGKISHPN